MTDGLADTAPESFEEMTEGQQKDWFQASSRLAQERPNARMVLRQKFSFMSAEERRGELVRAQEALSALDLADQIGDSREEEPFERDYRITLEETVKMLTIDPELGMG